MRPQRILLIEANEDGTVGGSHQALYDFVRHLDRSQYEPVVLFYQDNRFAHSLRSEGFEVHSFAAERARELTIRREGGRIAKLVDTVSAILRRRRFLREYCVDAIHINNSPAVGNDDWLPAAKLEGLPALANAMGDARGATRRNVIHRRLFCSFDRVLPISQFMTSAMFQAGIPSSRLTPIRLGVDIEHLGSLVRRTRAEVRRELGIADGQLFVLMVGNVREWKGQHVLLEALGRLSPTERQRFHVAFAGAVHQEGKRYANVLRASESRLNLSPHVTWLGGREDVPDLFAAADLAVHCSVRPEPFGLVVTEALALGTPVAATDFGGPAEVITPEAGWLYNPARPGELTAILRSVLSDPTLLKAKSVAARARGLEYSIQGTVRATEEAYRLTLPH